MTEQRDHAVVIGASMAGLLAARALAETVDRVSVLDRDGLDGSGPRRGVPQASHLHVLLPAGSEVLDGFFPGILDELAACGAPVADASRVRLTFAGYRLRPPAATSLRAVDASRSLLERHIRDRLIALGNVELHSDASVTGLALDRDVVRGVQLAGSDGERTLEADLVVDASGRGSRLPTWLESHGFPRPEEDRIRVDIGYASRRYRLPDGAFDGAQEVIAAAHPSCPRGAGLQLLEDGDWLVTLSGYLGEHPPVNDEGWLAFASGVADPEIHDMLRAGEPLGEIVRYRVPEARRRRYERLRRFPDRLVVAGDALCALNPVYGQGMSVAALEARLLATLLGDGKGRVARRFQRGAARIVDSPWEISVGGDLAFSGVDGRRTAKTKLLGRYVRRVQAAGSTDPKVALQFLRVITLLDPPPRLLRPAIAARVLSRRAPAPVVHDPDAAEPHVLSQLR